MRIEEFGGFSSELKQLCASFGRRYTDALAQAYWRVLRDAPLSEIETNVERILLSATRDTKFPAPAELRNEAPSMRRTPAMDAEFTKIEERSARTLDELRERDSDLWRLEVSIARTGRILAMCDPGTPQYDEASRRDRVYRDQRRALIESRKEQGRGVRESLR